MSEYRAYLRNKNKEHTNPQLPIDIHYDQWNRFENFLKFASKKEIRDRLKEFDPPSLDNYIDPDVIDKIRAASKPPQVARKTIIEKGKNELSAKEENRLRIEKMKKLYGLYKQFQEQEENEGKPIVVPSAPGEHPSTTSLPEVKPTPQKDDPIKMKQIHLNSQDVKLP